MGPIQRLFTGFRDFVGGLWQKLTGWWQRFAAAVLGSARQTDNGVTFSVPHEMTEAVRSKGGRILDNIPAAQGWTRGQKQDFARDVTANIPFLGRHLGIFFEKELALYLIRTYRLKATVRTGGKAGEVVARLTAERNAVLEAMRGEFRSVRDDSFTLDKFVAYTRQNVKTLGDQMVERTRSLLRCERVTGLEYTAGSGYFAGTTADITLRCDDRDQGWSVKYVSKPAVTVARWRPAQVYEVFGGRSARSDDYYRQLLNSASDPEEGASAVITDLWTALTGRKGKGKYEVAIDPQMVTSFISLFVQGSKNARIAGLNYTTGVSSMGDNPGSWSPMLDRQFAQDAKGGLAPVEGATAMARLGVNDRDRATFIKISYQPPGVAWNRATYLEFFVNLTNHMGRIIQVRMNNLVSQ